MTKFIIRWNAGYGPSSGIVDVPNLEAAQEQAYEFWREEAENNSDYEAVPYTKELAISEGLEEEEDDNCG